MPSVAGCRQRPSRIAWRTRSARVEDGVAIRRHGPDVAHRLADLLTGKIQRREVEHQPPGVALAGGEGVEIGEVHGLKTVWAGTASRQALVAVAAL